MSEQTPVTDPAVQEPVQPTSGVTEPVDSGAGAVIDNQTSTTAKTYTEEEMDAIVKKRIDKQNAKHAEQLEDLKKQLEEEGTSKQEIAAKLAEYEQKEKRHEAAEKVAVQVGLSASQIELLAGDTEEELLTAANAFKAASPNPYPVIKGDGGDPAPPSITKEQIYAIKNRSERVQAMAAHPELFN